jgi:hypothetical protein
MMSDADYRSFIKELVGMKITAFESVASFTHIVYSCPLMHAIIISSGRRIVDIAHRQQPRYRCHTALYHCLFDFRRYTLA